MVKTTVASKEKGRDFQIPKWSKEISKSPNILLSDFFRSFALLKTQEYKKQMEIYESKYHLSFKEFEKKVKNLKKENFEMWDDYIVWEGLYLSYQKWLKRYREL